MLSAIFFECMKEYCFDKNFHFKVGAKMKTLTLFMCRGKETFEFALSHFAQVKRAKIGGDEIFVWMADSVNFLLVY